MRNASISNEHIDIKQFFDEAVVAELDRVNNIVNKLEIAEGNYIIPVKYWWKSFYVNSRMLGVLLRQPNSYCQFAMTTRLLLEIAVDLEFVSKNRSNIFRLIDEQEKIVKRQSKNPSSFTHRKATKFYKNFQLHPEVYDNKKAAIGIKERIRLTNKKVLLTLYDELSAASHFNHMQIIWNGNMTTDKERLKSLTYLLQFYPLLLATTVNSIGEIIGNNKLGDNECVSTMEKAIDELHEKASSSNTEVIFEY